MRAHKKLYIHLIECLVFLVVIIPILCFLVIFSAVCWILFLLSDVFAVIVEAVNEIGGKK
jgi:hypothetical protein